MSKSVIDLFAELETSRKTFRGRLRRLKGKLKRSGKLVIYTPHRIRNFWLRGRRGWAPPDTYSLDSYLARVIAETLWYLAEHDHGYPVDMTEDSWAEWLKDTSAMFAAYVGTDDVLPIFEQDEINYQKVREGLDRLKSRWQSLWD